MRRLLESKEEKAKKQRRYQLVIGVFLVATMVVSSAGYAFYLSPGGAKGGGAGSDLGLDESIVYGGVEFQKAKNGAWIFSVAGNQYQTLNNPTQTENIPLILSKTIQDYVNQPLYFGADKAEELRPAGNQEILSNLNRFVSRSNPSCLTSECTEDYPLKSCSNDNIIIFNIINDTDYENIRVIEREKCVEIYSPGYDVSRASDAFLFKILGIQ